MKKIGIDTAKLFETKVISNKHNYTLSDAIKSNGKISKHYMNLLIVIDKIILKIPLQY